MRYITEADLRKRFGPGNELGNGLGSGTELRLGPDDRLTPAARDFIQARRIKIVILNAHDTSNEEKKLIRDPLSLATPAPTSTTSLTYPKSQDLFAVRSKPAHLTHLNATETIHKSHPRILLRGRLDSLIADVVLVQTELAQEGQLKGQNGPAVKKALAELRSWLGRILRSEVTGEPLPALTLGSLSYEQIREISHHPLRHLKHDHILPDVSQGLGAARLNRLRTQAREVELCAVKAFINPDGGTSRDDLILALNRLSSAIYILQILVVADNAGVTPLICPF